MIYKDYKNCKKTYIVWCSYQFKSICDPFYGEIVFQTNNKKRAIRKAHKFTNDRNSQYYGGWDVTKYDINVNTLTRKGKKLQKAFGKMFDKKKEDGIKSGKYRKTIMNGITFYTEKNLFSKS